MKKSDSLTPIGLAIGSGLLLYAMIAGGLGLGIFIDIPSIAITVGGSFAGVLIAFGMDDIKNLGKLIGQSFKESKDSPTNIVSMFAELSKKARKEGLLSLEEEISKIEDAYLKKGLQMVVDGIEPEVTREILELEIGEMERRHAHNASIFKIWGAYAPAFGMLGTLVGLVLMLADLGDASSIASGMATALLTTFYGSLLANLFCNPIGQNLSAKSQKEVAIRELMLEGILAIQSGVNPRIVEEKLITYLSPQDRLAYLSNNTSKNEGEE